MYTPSDYVKDVLVIESCDWAIIIERLIGLSSDTKKESIVEISDFGASNEKVRLLHALLGINTENGELQDQFKKHIFYGKPLDKVNLIEELGDLLWYVALACDYLQVPMEDVMQRNIAKLQARYKGKFGETQAKDRDLDKEREILEQPLREFRCNNIIRPGQIWRCCLPKGHVNECMSYKSYSVHNQTMYVDEKY